MNGTIKESLLYEPLRNGKVRCGVCERRCLIELDKLGWCRTRKNIEGKLYTLVYGDLSSIESRPIEIKPFFHFYPGSTALTFSTWSCNFYCKWCQNYHISKTYPEPKHANYVSPERIINMALKNNDNGLCVSFNEPTMLFEYSLDVFKLGKEKKLYTTYVSNGYFTLDALKMLKDAGIDGIKIDVKGNKYVYEKYCGGVREDFVWRNARKAKEMGIHIEIVHLVVSELNDNERLILEIIDRHLKELGEKTPLHFTRYFPSFEYHAEPTKKEILEFAVENAKKAGILYAYTGNIPGHKYENTYCHNCNKLLIERRGYRIKEYNLKGRNCPNCKVEIPIVV